MKKTSPFKTTYYYGLGVASIVLLVVVTAIVGLYNKVNGVAPFGHGRYEKWDTTYHQFVVWDTVVKPVYKQTQPTPRPKTEVKVELPTPILDTTK